MTKSFYRIRAQVEDPSAAEVQIDDFIGDWIDGAWGMGISAKQFLTDLAALGPEVNTIRVRINSPGGDVSAAVAIANALRDQRASKGRTVETVVDGMAASAATLVLVAGTPAKVADNAIVMIHNPWSAAVGDAATFRKEADTLDTFRDTIITTYQWKSPLDAKQLQKMMDAETWMNADEAIAAGLADEKIAGAQANASLDPSALLHLSVPERFRARVAQLVRPTAPKNVVPTDVSMETAPRDEGWSALTLEDFTSDPWESLTDARKREIAGHFAWANEMPPDTFGDLKLGHHRSSDGYVVFEGIAAAAARLDQTEGIDVAEVRAHLERHYHDFDEKAPWEPATEDEKKKPAPMPMEPTPMEQAAITVKVDAQEITKAVGSVQDMVECGLGAAELLAAECVAAGLDAAFTLALMRERLPVAEWRARVASESERRAAESKRVEGIRAVCAHFKQTDVADEMIATGATVEQAKAFVLKIKAKADRVEIDGGLDPDAKITRRKGLSAVDVYRERLAKN